MPRRRYLITYDIADDKRRTKLFKTLQGEGDHAQYSVFFCECDEAELAALRATITEIIHHDDNQVLILDLGPGANLLEASLEIIGKHYKPPTRVLVV
mgnify:CR=1 FL=1